MVNGPTLPPQAYTREILTSAFNWLQTQPESVKKLATTPDALVGLFMRAQRYGASSMEVDAPVSSQNFISDLKNLAEGLKQFEKPKPAAPHSGVGSGSNLNTHGSSHAAHPASHMGASGSLHHAAPSPINMNRSSAAFAGATVSPHAVSNYAPQAPQAPPTQSHGQTHTTSPAHHSASTQAAAPGAHPTNSHAQTASHAMPHSPSPYMSPSPSTIIHPEPAPNLGHGSANSHVHNSGQSAASAQMGLTYSHTSTTVHASAAATQPMLNERSQQMIQEVKTQLNLSSNAETINMLLALGFKQLKGLLAD